MEGGLAGCQPALHHGLAYSEFRAKGYKVVAELDMALSEEVGPM